MPDFEHKNLATPDEVRTFPHGRVEIANLASGPIGRATYEPGWRWSNDIKPMAKTDSCQVNHAAYVLSGRMHLKMADGQEFEVGPGEVATIAPGHDAWVLGNEPCVIIDWGAISTFAK
jgi:mannose-6-phosphate isomerase-like protein (cupin superfamily)